MVATLERGQKTLKPKKTYKRKQPSNHLKYYPILLWFAYFCFSPIDIFRTNAYFVKREDCAYDYIAQGKVCTTCMSDSKCCEYLLFFIGFDKINILFMD